MPHLKKKAITNKILKVENICLMKMLYLLHNYIFNKFLP